MSDCWHGCYREGWGKRLCPASYAHPAKAAYGLTVRIYEHALEEGWIEPRGVVLDPFAGIGGFALEAMRHGLHFVGCELEQRFVDNGQGCDCTGIGKADWVRFQGRWDKIRYEDGRHWCPECLAQADAVTGEREFKPMPLPGTEWAIVAKMNQSSVFTAAPSSSYARNSGRIPCTGPHHYRGNIETWEAQGMPGSAVIVQGDSRRLGEVLERASLCLSSPPYASSPVDAYGENPGGGLAGRKSQDVHHKDWKLGQGYGQTEGNLGNLPDTDFEAALATDCDDTNCPAGLGRSGSNLEGGFLEGHCPPLPQDSGTAGLQAALAVSSPAWMGSGVGGSGNVVNANTQCVSRNRPESIGPGETARGLTYGSEPGQLAQMPEGDLVAVISSPPFLAQSGGTSVTAKSGPLADASLLKRHSAGNQAAAGYGESDGQLAALPEGDHAEACERPVITISSPPFKTRYIANHYEGAQAACDAWLSGSLQGNPIAFSPSNIHVYGVWTRNWSQCFVQFTDKRIVVVKAAMPKTGAVQACISSPPFGAAETRNRTSFQGGDVGDMMSRAYTQDKQGTSPGQLAQMPPGDHAEALEAGAETGKAQCAISSPPWERSDLRKGGSLVVDKAIRTGRNPNSPSVQSCASDTPYGKTEGQLGQETGSTFWAASRQILEQVYQVLAPGGHAIWVLKMFVRSGRLVDFPGQWEALCQSVGFKTVCKHRAWLNKNAGIIQTTLDGDEVSMEKWFKSFFRRLCESKGSPRIDFEMVLCMVKEAK